MNLSSRLDIMNLKGIEMPNYINTDIPFEIIKKPNEDYFASVEEAQQAGFALNQIWSVSEQDHEFCYGPSHHIIDVIGYIATNETHDGETYYTVDESADFE